MQPQYNAAIKAGVIGGIILAAYAVIVLIVGIFNISLLTLICGCLAWVVIIVAGAGTGALAVRYAAAVLTKWADALIASGVAGAIAGIIYAVITVVIAFIAPFLNISSYTSANDLGASLAGNALGSAFAGVATCICAPVWVVIIIILALIGGAIYGAMKLKLS